MRHQAKVDSNDYYFASSLVLDLSGRNLVSVVRHRINTTTVSLKKNVLSVHTVPSVCDNE